MTEWETDTPNHVYLLNDAGKLVAYVKASSQQWETFQNPLPFYTSKRKFKTLWTG